MVFGDFVDWEFVTCADTVSDALAEACVDERTLSAWLTELIVERETDRLSVIRRSHLNQTFAYQIFAGTRRPSRDKLIQLAFGFGLGAVDTCELLERGGVSALLPRCRRDVVIAFCLEHGLDLDTCDDLLWEQREQTLMQPDS